MISIQRSNDVPRRSLARRELSSRFLQQDVIDTNKRRCEQILECKRQIDFWRTKLEALEKEQTTQLKLARLRLDAASFWRSLSPKDRTNKEFILAAMESRELPQVLEDFPSSNLPPTIRTDKDILLARVARDDFQAKYDDDRFWVPPKLRGDKEVIMAILPKNCDVVECMSNNLRDDEEIFRLLLSSTSTLPNYVLQHFSERIRSDRKLVLKLCAHPTGIQSLQFVSSHLRNDKEFMLEAIQVSHSRDSINQRNKMQGKRGSGMSGSSDYFQILRYASHRLQDDSDIVLAAVAKNGYNLKYASYKLRRDFTTVMKAMEDIGEAFRYCLPGEAKERVLSDRNLVLNKVMKNNTSLNTRRMCLDRFQTDHEIVLEVVASGLDWSSVPWTLQNSREFIKAALMRNPRSYMSLPEALREEFEIASTAIQGEFVNDSVLLEATERCPMILHDRKSMLTIGKAYWTDVLHETLQFSPLSIRGDKEVMLQAIESSPRAFEFCSEELMNDKDIVMATIKSCPNMLYMIPSTFQLENPDVIITAIECCDRNDSWSLYEDVYEELWLNREVAISWLSKFGDWLYDDFPEEFEEDEEMCLMLVKKNWTDFSFNFSVGLKDSKDFMLKAVSLDARVVAALDDDTNKHLRYDDDLTLLAFSKDKRAIQFYSGGDDFEYMVSFTDRLRQRIRDYEAFNQVFCESILRPSHDNPDSSLSLLNLGPDATKYHTHLIGSYLGLPNEEELQMLLAASNNLLHWGF